MLETRILIVEDDDAIRDAMREFLTYSGYRAFPVASAEEAVEFLKTTAVEVMVTDIILPGMDGLKLCDRVKKDYDVDVIVMTGYSGEYSYEDAISKGASDFVFKPVRFEELVLRIKRVLRERGLREEQRRILDKLRKLAITDGLTRLYNSRYFYSQLEMEVIRTKRYGHPLSLLLLDIDHFKLFNDTYGHVEGDKVLIRIAQIIKSRLRKMDSAYRYGGEEFTVILPETTAEAATVVAQRIRQAVAEETYYPQKETPVTITVSLGLTQYGPSDTITAFIKRSDKALYSSKANGRNQVSCILAD